MHCNCLSKLICKYPAYHTFHLDEPFHLVFSFPRFYRNERKFLNHSITSARLPAKKKMENLVAFYGWYNSTSYFFSYQKNYHLSLTENFHRDLRISVCVLANRYFPLTNWVKIMFEQFLNFRIL